MGFAVQQKVEKSPLLPFTLSLLLTLLAPAIRAARAVFSRAKGTQLMPQNISGVNNRREDDEGNDDVLNVHTS